MSPPKECEHEWGPVMRSPIAGTPHRPCMKPFCRHVTLDLEDDEPE